MDRFQILSDVFAPIAVPPGGAHCQAAVLIDQFHGAAVHFGLYHVVKFFAGFQESFQASIEFPGFIFVERVFQGQHGNPMGHALEFFQGFRPDPLGGGIRRHQFRVLFLQADEFLHKAVKFGIRNNRIIENMVTIVVVVNLFPQFLAPIYRLVGGCFRLFHGRS